MSGTFGHELVLAGLASGLLLGNFGIGAWKLGLRDVCLETLVRDFALETVACKL